ncbi:hypothetical protein GCM10007235_32710 [Pseudoxanthomonas indica]|nr:hypothetical protein GCM10007235_32710 [Pseudoxanthomonas indica]
MVSESAILGARLVAMAPGAEALVILVGVVAVVAVDVVDLVRRPNAALRTLRASTPLAALA